MRAFFIRRLLGMIPSFLGITLVVFMIVRLSPGDPLSMRGDLALQANAASTKAVEEYRELLGLNDPIMVGYGKWLLKLAKGDLGTSFKYNLPVTDMILEALPITLGLSVVALFITYLVAIPIGIFSAVKPGSFLDRVLTLVLFVLYSLPSQWVGILLIVSLGVGLGWFPIQGLHSQGETSFTDLVMHVVLPIICLTYASFASLSRYMRASMLDTIRQDFIRTARAKGLSERVVVLKHALRNSLISIVTLLGLTLPALIGGSVIIERIFGLPGMGNLSFEAILGKDIPVLMGTTALAGVLTMFGLLLSDILYAIVDPRISMESR